MEYLILQLSNFKPIKTLKRNSLSFETHGETLNGQEIGQTNLQTGLQRLKSNLITRKKMTDLFG